MDDKLRAVLEQIESYGELRDLGGTRYEKSALLAGVSKRRLIAWEKRRNKYELTPAGHKRLADIRAGVRPWPPGLRSAMVIGATLSVAGLAIAGFYFDAIRLPFGGPTSAAAVPMRGAGAEPGSGATLVIDGVANSSDAGREPQLARDAAAIGLPAAATPATRSVPDAGAPPQLAKAEEPLAPATTPTQPAAPAGAVPESGVQPTAPEQPIAIEPPPSKGASSRHGWRHRAHHRTRHDGFDVALAINRFAQRFLSPRNSRKR